MELVKCLAKLSTIFHSPFFELPGEEIQMRMSPIGRDQLMNSIERDYRSSAVMILLYPDEAGHANTLFIERTTGYGVHGGQIALPGGAFEEKDTNLIQTAIRETEEEIGVRIDTANVLGKLTNLKVPVSGFEITPVISYTQYPIELNIDEVEVKQVIEISVEELKNKKVQHGEFTTHTGIKVQAPYYSIEGHKLWGATAMITAEFLELL